jgi:hypothetical protein
MLKASRYSVVNPTNRDGWEYSAGFAGMVRKNRLLTITAKVSSG